MKEYEDYINNKYENKKTARGYINDCKMFLEFIEEKNVLPEKTKEMHIMQYQITLKEKGYSNHTIARKISSLRIFFKYLRITKKMQHNPLEEIKQPMVEKREEKLSYKQWGELMEAVGDNERDKLFLTLIYKEKIRINDLIKINVEDYNKNQGILYLEKKAVSLESETKKMLDTHVEEKNGYDFLFNSKRGEVLTEAGAYFIVKSYLKKIGLEYLRPIDLVK